MNEFAVLKQEEMEDVNGGGFLSMAAGAIAGYMIGTYVSIPVAIVKKDARIVAKGGIFGASVGAFVGAGCPLP